MIRTTALRQSVLPRHGVLPRLARDLREQSPNSAAADLARRLLRP